VTYAVGGESEADIANAVLAKDDAAEINFFAEIRRLQILRGQTPNVVVWMNEGHNQRNETIASVGRRAITDPDSPLALLDNFEAIQRHYDALWQAQGWDVQELTYIIVVDHPVSDPDDDKLIAYRAILQSYEARLARTSVFNWLDVLSFAEMDANGSFADGLHLVNDLDAGYDFLAQRFVAALIS
jgi:hypothetical protein